MRAAELQQVEADLGQYLEGLLGGMGGRRETREAMGLYVTGLMLRGERKSMGPMAARLVTSAAQSEVEAMRQRLQECVGRSEWAEEALLAQLALQQEELLPEMEALAADDTGLKKKGTHSVGVAQQYSGTFGKVENCQVVVSLSLVGERGSCPIAFRVYLPKEWVEDEVRRKETGVPATVCFEEKWRLSLAQVEAAVAWGLKVRRLVADAGYGDVLDYRRGLRDRGFTYFLGIRSSLVFWAEKPGLTPQRPLSAEALARAVPKAAFTHVAWREGSRGPQESRFAALRVRAAPDWHHGCRPETEEWLLVEWPAAEEGPTRFWVSNAPDTLPLKELVRLCKLRWRVEQDYEQLKQELGFSHFEGRGWRGFHHHAALCAVAYGFLALQRAYFPPQGSAPLSPTRA